MKRVLLIFSLLLALDALAQEQMLRLPQADDHPSDAVRSAPLYGKKIIVFGDSYVQNAGCPIEETWHYKLAEKYNMEYHNWGRNGNCLAYEWKTDQFGLPMHERYKELPDTEIDYILVFGGHNDAVLMNRYGSDTEFFRSRLRVLCAGLRHKYPSAKICFITPWTNPQPMYQETVRAIRDVCSEFDIPVYDAFHRSGMLVRFRYIRRHFFQSEHDNAHLNARGHDTMLPKMEHFLLHL